ncbi:TetR/AcrR family transcriptional regulator [Erwinia sp. PK3-005]|uniref:TetR/AcrR family transcriptional regulator n=1 Tax=Mixta hanseatica TaxID=2872648 RepID=A0ABY4R8T7_9GAMM|nr:TetR/AcrR family transcriptional regulator [Mixta hanseatica]UQY44052.1 TetR/AcrR family transcriptional regulator [Mixta hanseatica]
MSDRKQVILDTATELFNREGYQAVGVDKIITTAGVSKLTLYRHFPSKEALIQSVLEQRKSQFLTDLNAALAQQDSPKAQLQAFFAYYENWFQSDDFRGCMFMNSVLEFGEKSQALLAINRGLREELIALLSQILRHWLKRKPAQRIAYTCNMLIDGAIMSQVTWGKESEYSPADIAWSTAKNLLATEGVAI